MAHRAILKRPACIGTRSGVISGGGGQCPPYATRYSPTEVFCGKLADLIKEIKQLRSRVVELEKRVAEFEMQQTELHADQRGVLFNAQGKPVGIWGVDGEYDSLSR